MPTKPSTMFSGIGGSVNHKIWAAKLRGLMIINATDKAIEAVLQRSYLRPAISFFRFFNNVMKFIFDSRAPKRVGVPSWAIENWPAWLIEVLFFYLIAYGSIIFGYVSPLSGLLIFLLLIMVNVLRYRVVRLSNY